jgi:hypothetical protein
VSLDGDRARDSDRGCRHSWLLAAQDRAEPWSVIQSCYAAQLSEAALEWLIKAGVIKPEQRGDAAAILRGISKWLEHANG